MRYIIVDLEATCWEDGHAFDRMETIEIGAVELASARGPMTREFGRFIRPVDEPRLSAFCTELTTIRQEDVDQAEPFETLFPQFVEWVGPESFVLGSWGGYDLTQLRTDCRRHRLELPASFERHVNLKKEFARLRKTRVCGMARALQQAGLPLMGTHHRGIDDARNIAQLAMLILPKLEAAGMDDGRGAG